MLFRSFNEPKQPDLIQRHLGSLSAGIFASPEYLKERGTPKSLEDLKSHDLVIFGEGISPVATVNWLPELLQKKGLGHHVALRVNNIYGIYRAVQAGIGIGSLPEYFVREGRGIVQVLPDVQGPPLECYFVYPEELRQSARVSVFRDFLLREISKARAQPAGAKDGRSDGQPGPVAP